MNWANGDYVVSDDSSRLNLDVICSLLKSSYWAANRPAATIAKSIEHSLCFGLYCRDGQIGFGRVISDFSTYSYLCDVIIDPNHRGKGLGKWLVQCILDHPALRGTRVGLYTKDAQTLYEKFGFSKHPFDCLTKSP